MHVQGKAMRYHLPSLFTYDVVEKVLMAAYLHDPPSTLLALRRGSISPAP